MKKMTITKVLEVLFLLFFLNSTIIGANKNSEKDKNLNKIKSTKDALFDSSQTKSRTRFNINNISTWIYNDGQTDNGPHGNSGLIFPKGSDMAAVFQSGFVWGALISGEKRVNGATYSSGLRPGRIIGEGATAVREDEELDHVRIYRVRKNLNDGFSSEINDGEGSAEEIREQYEKDWNEWPAEYGAPYDDVDNDGIYNSSFDIPGVPGADQTIWYVANDLDTITCRSLYGSDPMGVEMQVTFWGYNSGAEIGNTMFRKFKLINKSKNTFDEMYVSIWADPDLGEATDDFIGCDSTLSLMYVYNGTTNDAVYGGNPPAVGFDFFQGPVIPSIGDTALVDGKYKLNYKNLAMTVHYPIFKGDPVYNDPDLGDYVKGTLAFYNFFEGRASTLGDPFPTKFALAGNPVTGVGWIDGMMHPPGDRRQGMAAGPFIMAVGDTQEVVVAFMAAFGDNRLDAITKLKNADYYMQGIYNNNFSGIEKTPIPPKVSASFIEENRKAILTWEQSSEIEEFDSDGYKFQGYNIFQTGEGTQLLIKTFDIIDGVKTISQLEYDSDSETEIMKDVQFGTDSGIEYEFIIEKDYINDSKLLKGKEYYFSVVAYTYTPDESKRIRTSNSNHAFAVFRYIYNSYGFNFGEAFDVKRIAGSGDVDLSIKVYDSDLITGDDYEVFFNKQHYYLAADGNWHETNFPDSVGKRLNKDVSPSTMIGSAIYSLDVGTIDLKLVLDLVSPTEAWVDGIEITLPAGITINSIQPAHSNYSSYAIDFVQTGNTIFWGRKDTTQGGVYSFAGGEVLDINVAIFDAPMAYHYVIYDDGYGSGDPLAPINAEGDYSIAEIGYEFRTENHWNLFNTTQNEFVLEKQRVFGGEDKYARFWDTSSETTNLIVDGFQISVDGSFAPPVSQYNQVKTTINGGIAVGAYDIDDYGVYGWAPTGRSVDVFGNGTQLIDELQKDYELRFTGEYKAPDANGVVYIKDGTGSIATLYGARGYSIADHPMNPSPGTDAPFLVRIPFEVWCVDDNRQVNLLVYDRKGDPEVTPFYAFNPTDRVYCEINNTEYDEYDVNSGNPLDSDTDSLTWNLIFWTTDWVKDDVVQINFANPIQVGKDRFSFATLVKGKNTLTEYSISQNYPNPFNPLTKIDFTLLNDGFVNLTVYDILGREVTRLIDNKVRAGEYTITFNASNLASGVYIYRISTTDFIEVKKMLLLK